MPNLTAEKALEIALEYYSKKYTYEDAKILVDILTKVDIAGLIQCAYEKGVGYPTPFHNALLNYIPITLYLFCQGYVIFLLGPMLS